MKNNKDMESDQNVYYNTGSVPVAVVPPTTQATNNQHGDHGDQEERYVTRDVTDDGTEENVYAEPNLTSENQPEASIISDIHSKSTNQNTASMLDDDVTLANNVIYSDEQGAIKQVGDGDVKLVPPSSTAPKVPMASDIYAAPTRHNAITDLDDDVTLADNVIYSE